MEFGGSQIYGLMLDSKQVMNYCKISGKRSKLNQTILLLCSFLLLFVEQKSSSQEYLKPVQLISTKKDSFSCQNKNLDE